MSMRHDRREQERQQRQRQQHRRGSGGGRRAAWLAPAIIAAALVLAILGARAAGMFETGPSTKVDLSPTPAPSGEVLGTHQTDNGNPHLPRGQAVPYPVRPPTSGPHWDLPHAGWGVKDAQASDEMLVHNLEHGGIAVLYRGLSGDELGQLKTLVRQLNGSGYPKVVLEPYGELTDAKVAVTAWNWVLKQPSYDQGQIVRFVQLHYGSRGEAPEPNGN